jgi:hypothetical protein
LEVDRSKSKSTSKTTTKDTQSKFIDIISVISLLKFSKSSSSALLSNIKSLNQIKQQNSIITSHHFHVIVSFAISFSIINCDSLSTILRELVVLNDRILIFSDSFIHHGILSFHCQSNWRKINFHDRVSEPDDQICSDQFRSVTMVERLDGRKRLKERSHLWVGQSSQKNEILWKIQHTSRKRRILTRTSFDTIGSSRGGKVNE